MDLIYFSNVYCMGINKEDFLKNKTNGIAIVDQLSKSNYYRNRGWFIYQIKAGFKISLHYKCLD